MDKREAESMIALQKQTCKNQECQYILKEIYFYEGWEKRCNRDNGVSLVRNNGSSYYVCPLCKAKNFVIHQGEKIILEKIVRCELHKQ